jgi:hypothetical protein
VAGIEVLRANPHGKASGTLSMLRQLGRAFGVALCVAGFGRFGDRTTPQAFCDGFAAATSVAAMLPLAGALTWDQRAPAHADRRPSAASIGLLGSWPFQEPRHNGRSWPVRQLEEAFH